jgi:hypothetical protein
MIHVVRHVVRHVEELYGHVALALLVCFEEALAGHIAFLAARGVIWSPACVIWRRFGNLESSLVV